jgi:hypothetical protein
LPLPDTASRLAALEEVGRADGDWSTLDELVGGGDDDDMIMMIMVMLIIMTLMTMMMIVIMIMILMMMMPDTASRLAALEEVGRADGDWSTLDELVGSGDDDDDVMMMMVKMMVLMVKMTIQSQALRRWGQLRRQVVTLPSCSPWATWMTQE